MANNIIATFDLSKKFRLKGKKEEIIALDNVNISVKSGEIYGLLGPNGAGKTTLIYILTTLRQPTSGTAIIDGYDILKKPNKAKSKVALMLNWWMLYGTLTGYENLRFICKVYEVPNYKTKIYDIAKEFELEKWLDQRVIYYSTGMMIKLALCRTLLLDREIIFLDEPTLGLDVNIKQYIINKIKCFKDKTIFLTSHDMGVVEKLCHRIAFINKGKIIKVGSKNDIERYGQSEVKIVVEILESKEKLINDLNQQDYIKEVINTENIVNIIIKRRDYYPNLLSVLSKYKIVKVKEYEQELDDLFIQIIKNDNQSLRN